MRGLLDEDDLYALLMANPLWRLAGGALVRDWSFASFAAAVAFVNQVATLSEEVDHHPDIDIRYNKVRLALVSHDVGGITARDVRWLARLERVLNERATV